MLSLLVSTRPLHKCVLPLIRIRLFENLALPLISIMKLFDKHAVPCVKHETSDKVVTRGSCPVRVSCLIKHDLKLQLYSNLHLFNASA